MKRSWTTGIVVAGSLVACVALLVGCQRGEQPSTIEREVGEALEEIGDAADATAESVGEAMDEAAETVGQALDEAGDTLDEAAETMGETLDEAGRKLENATGGGD